MTGGSRLFRQGGVLLHRLVYFTDGRVDLFQCDGLIHRLTGYIADSTIDRSDLFRDSIDDGSGVADVLDPARDFSRRSGNETFDLLGRFGGTLRERAHFRRNDGKSPSVIARPRRLDARVQSEKIGLERDLVDDADNAGNLLRRGFDAVHGVDGLLDDLRAHVGIVLGRRNRVLCLARRIRRFVDRVRKVDHRRPGLLRQAAWRSVRAAKSSTAVVISVARLGDGARAGLHARQRPFYGVERFIVIRLQLAISGRNVVDQAVREIFGSKTRQSRPE